MSNAALEKLQYVSDHNGNVTGVFVPIEVWREIEAELETRYLLQSEAMRKRLLEARKRDEGIPLEEALEKLGV
jgi:PHD/YefM family antitoxin component YafN of YafNO toxin-antitoxin module